MTRIHSRHYQKENKHQKYPLRSIEQDKDYVYLEKSMSRLIWRRKAEYEQFEDIS